MLHSSLAEVYYLEKQEPHDPEREARLWVSDLAYGEPDKGFKRCQRELKLRLTNAPGVGFTAGTLLKFEGGHWAEDQVAKWLEAAEIGYQREKKCDLDDDITGRLDYKIYLAGIGVVEVKAPHPGSRQFKDQDEADEDHALQGMTYGFIEGADWVQVVYIDRGGANFIRIRDVEIDKDRIFNAATVIRGVRDSDILPPILDTTIVKRKPSKNVEFILDEGVDFLTGEPYRNFHKNPPQCRYCKYLNVSCEGALKTWKAQNE